MTRQRSALRGAAAARRCAHAADEPASYATRQENAHADHAAAEQGRTAGTAASQVLRTEVHRGATDPRHDTRQGPFAEFPAQSTPNVSAPTAPPGITPTGTGVATTGTPAFGVHLPG
ncbi:hypothetical protein [Streptomyces sirii]|uniref:hypothetical protein n=1 Tax=Streptomyces sirii TaxID=3127701 RepID=UPI003D3665FE